MAPKIIIFLIKIKVLPRGIDNKGALEFYGMQG
jgi:hypothetical protein